MSLFRKKSASAQPDYSGLAIQTSTSAAPIPIIYGVTRVAPNIIWRDGVNAAPVKSSGGGKGGGGTVSGYDYSTWIMFAIGEGPVRSIGTIYNGQAAYPYGSYFLSLFPGSTPQTPWPQLTPRFASASLAYPGTAYMASSYFDLGSSATLPSIAFEVYGRLQATSQTVNLYDADPSVCVIDFLTNSQYGVGFPPASLNAATLQGTSGDASYQSYCKAAGLAFSPALTDQETANSILTRWLQITNTAAIWSGGQLKLVPYGDLPVTMTPQAMTTSYTVAAPAYNYSNNTFYPTVAFQAATAASFVSDGGVVYAGSGAALTAVTTMPVQGQYNVSAGLYTFAAADQGAVVKIAYVGTPAGAYTPNLTPVYDLTDDDFVYEDGQDPVQVARVDPYAVANVQRLECFDRSNQYAATPVEARDQNAIEQFGLRIGSTITAHEICDLGIGLTVVQLILQRGLYVRNSYSFKLSWECCLLEPMDVVTLTDSGLGLAKTPVRLVSIEEDADGLLAVTAEELPGGVATVATYQAQPNAATMVNRNVAPAAVNAPVIVEPPSQLTGGTPQLWAAVSGGANDVADPNWGGAFVWISRDGVNFVQVGQVQGPARQGVTTAALAAPVGPNPDAVNTLAVDLGECAGTLASATPTDAANGVTLAMVDHELVAYATATLTAANKYALTGLQRGLYGSKAVAHAAGAPFARLDSSVFRYTFPTAYIGQQLTLKFQSFNLYGGALQALSTCAAYNVTPIGSGLFGPTAQMIVAGTSFDEGLASQAASQVDDYGLASDPYTAQADDGLASDGLTTATPVSAGGTGAAAPSAARANLGAAASGANGDITSLTGLTGLAVGTALDPNNPLVVKAATALFDNTGGSVAITIDKATAASSASHLYQTGYSGRAQAGLLGSDRYRISVSAAGASFTQALDIDPATGHVGLAGYTADANNALGVAGTACLFTAATDSMRFTFNKVAAANDATLSFQTGFSARALLGTTGSDQFQLKVSPDGSTFFQVFVVDQTTGNAAFKALLGLMPYAVASLPSAAFNGALAFASNGRKLMEASGSGTGVVVAYSNGAWRRLSDDTVVAS